jgi:hypothetical protein
MKGMPSLSTFSAAWRRLRRFNIPEKSLRSPKVDRIDPAEEAAATTNRIRRLVQISRVLGDLPDESIESNTRDSDPESFPSPAMPNIKKDQQKTTRLWGREFTVTDGGGLAQDQVSEFVEGLLSRNQTLEEQVTPATMGNYIHKLMGELQNVEESIQNQVRRDAEVEATRITAEASRLAEETITRARTEATELARQEAEGILIQARKKAEIADSQIRIQAQLMLGKVREQMEVRIQQEGEKAYNRLLTSLSALNQEVQRIENEWKQERAQLWRSDDVKVALGATGLSGLPLIQEALNRNLGNFDPENSDGRQSDSGTTQTDTPNAANEESQS